MKKIEKYIVFEESETFLRKVDFNINNKDFILEVINSQKIKSIEELNKQNIKADKIILALKGDKATTVEGSFKIERSTPDSPITESELDNLVFKGLWEFLNKYRTWASNKMGISDLDMTLYGIEVADILIDSHNVIDPVGIKGKNFYIKIKGTFIPRDVLSYVSEFNFFGKTLEVIEKNSTTSSLLSDREGFVLNCGTEKTELFSIKNNNVSFKKSFDWGLDLLINEVSKLLKTNKQDSKSILNRYFNKRVSSKLKRRIDKSIKPHFKKINDIIKSISLSKKEKIYINIQKNIFENNLKKKKSLNHINFKEILELKELNVIINLKEEDEINLNSDYLALVGCYIFYSPHYDNLNKILNRRSKWLVPNKK
ncbi:MAG: hypothetical protein WDZ80_05880 [Candidatus Paceibacterota bacterium]